MFQLKNNMFCIFCFLQVVITMPGYGQNSPASNLTQVKDRKNILLADPTIYYTKGTYYLYGTGGGQFNNGFAVYTSSDLKTWSGPNGASEGYALKKGHAYGNSKFWAPQVFQHGNKYYMAYAASEHIAIAVSDSPLGPFKQESSKPISEEVKQIDAYVFADDDGKKYLYYVVVANGGNRIFVAEINDDMRTVKNETAKLCIEATEFWENTARASWSVTEGPTVTKHKGLYYLIYSANDFRNTDYAVGYATSKTPFGPFKKFEGNPIIHKTVTGQNGSGHGDLFKTSGNKWMYVFHTHHSVDSVGPRKTAIVEMRFVRDNEAEIDKLTVIPQSFHFLYR